MKLKIPEIVTIMLLVTDFEYVDAIVALHQVPLTSRPFVWHTSIDTTGYLRVACCSYYTSRWSTYNQD
jgi:hypothetical protein